MFEIYIESELKDFVVIVKYCLFCNGWIVNKYFLIESSNIILVIKIKRVINYNEWVW